MAQKKDVEEFKASFPCSGLPDRAITFEFEKKSGNLVDIHPDSRKFGGDGLRVLSEDCWAHYRQTLDT